MEKVVITYMIVFCVIVLAIMALAAFLCWSWNSAWPLLLLLFWGCMNFDPQSIARMGDR